MKNNFMKIINLVAIGLVSSNLAMAIECDSINSMANLEGALTLSNYVANGRGSFLVPWPSEGGICQNGSMSMLTMDPAITSNVGDAQILGIFKELAEGEFLYASFSISAPTLPLITNMRTRELKIRDIEFSNPESKENAHLIFSIVTEPGTSDWYLSGQLKYINNKSTIEEINIPYAPLYSGALGHQQIKIHMRYQNAMQGGMLMLSYFHGETETFLNTYQLNAEMLPLTNRSGLLGQANIPQNVIFYSSTCVNSSCFYIP
jgi:hypothetical protein